MTALPVDTAGDDERTHIVRVPSQLTHVSAADLKRSVEQIVALKEADRIVLDLTLVEVVTSIGVTSLLEVRQIADDADAALVLAGLSPEHYKFFTLLRVDRLFAFSGSVEDAVAGASE